MSEPIDNEMANLFGLKRSRIGKTEARQRFLPLVNQLANESMVFEITEHDKPVAMLVSYGRWAAMVSQLKALTKNAEPKPIDLRGSIEILGDLEAGSKRAGEELLRSMRRRAKNL